MNVAQLIESLGRLDPDLPVYWVVGVGNFPVMGVAARDIVTVGDDGTITTVPACVLD